MRIALIGLALVSVPALFYIVISHNYEVAVKWGSGAVLVRPAAVKQP